ncbi:twin-arginine translocase TatA/TatE family subunit [Tsuneonella sp. YG55]|jgi:sec-independent protein translocase protein TatA|uniref:Sec-independent protein translocase protein TatA n=1 Tax=Tsuneonella litorea TaxID=2976475 RepID=A0A9X3ANH4_9SPHN|nr:twin-arginine translocase TatA/TatE family subunit [Tsuneonella litorea]MCT2559697.1 twin-arginine translocase TatA/TatE family subunit [Tsuneonella litorea]
MGSFSIWHWLIVLLVVLVLFGKGRVGDIMGEFGKGIKSFKKGIADDESEANAKAAAAKPVHSLEGPHHDAKPAGEATKEPHPGAEHRD